MNSSGLPNSNDGFALVNEGEQPILWAGQFTDPTGYGEEARSFVLACEREGRPIAGEEWSAFKTRVAMTSEQERAVAAALARVPPKPYVNVWHKRPPVTLRATPYGHGPTIIRTMFEADVLPIDWLQALGRVDEIWVPSRFNQQTFARSGVPASKINVLPQTLDFSLFDPECTTPLPLPASARNFCFLSVFAFSYRKGWDILLDAWCEAFEPHEDVCLVLKITNLRTSLAPANELAAYIAGRPHAPIICETRILSADEMPRLYAMCDAYVAPSRGEGWGRPYMEAMAMGLPTIASRWGGNLDFTTDRNSFLVHGEVVAVVEEKADAFFHGTRWFEPDREELVRLMRELFEGCPAVLERAQTARASLVERYGERAVVGQLVLLAQDAIARWR